MSLPDKPNFLIIGAAKSGTSSIYRYLQQHPDIYMAPTKETNFFAYCEQELNFRWWGETPVSILDSITSIEDYNTQFNDVTIETAIGEASPLYLYNAKAPERIKHFVPNIKMIAILRNPADRAFSHYSHLRRDNREPYTSFMQALQAEADRMEENWTWDYYYRDAGFYFRQLSRYYSLFDPAQIKIFLFEEMKNDMQHVLKEIFCFLGVEDSFKPDTAFRYNVSGIPKNRTVHKIISRPNSIIRVAKQIIPRQIRRRAVLYTRKRNLVKIEMDDNDKKYLDEVYKDDLLNLQNLINKDISDWL